MASVFDFRKLVTDSMGWEANRRVLFHATMALMARPLFRSNPDLRSANAYDNFALDVIKSYRLKGSHWQLDEDLQVADESLIATLYSTEPKFEDKLPRFHCLNCRFFSKTKFFQVALIFVQLIPLFTDEAVSSLLSDIEISADRQSFASQNLQKLCLQLSNCGTEVIRLRFQGTIINVEIDEENGDVQITNPPMPLSDIIDITASEEWTLSQRVFFHYIAGSLIHESIDEFNDKRTAKEYVDATQALIRSYAQDKGKSAESAIKSVDSAFAAVSREIKSAYEDFKFSHRSEPTSLELTMPAIQAALNLTPQLEYPTEGLATDDFKYAPDEGGYYSDSIDFVTDEIKNVAKLSLKGEDYTINDIDGIKHTVDHHLFFHITGRYLDEFPEPTIADNRPALEDGMGEQDFVRAIDDHYSEAFQSLFVKHDCFSWNKTIIEMKRWLRVAIEYFFNGDSGIAVHLTGIMVREAVLFAANSGINKVEEEILESFLSEAVQLLVYFLEGDDDEDVEWVQSLFDRIKQIIKYDDIDDDLYIIDLMPLKLYLMIISTLKNQES